jgi:transcriptional regulator with XRE-family HTH domain
METPFFGNRRPSEYILKRGELNMSHWTQESVEDFAYHLSLDFFAQLEDRLEDEELSRKDFAEESEVSAGRISQIFNSPPENPKINSLVKYAQVLGLKVSIVAYDDDDPTNDKGPVFSGVIAKCWERMGKPRDLSAFSDVADTEQQLAGLLATGAGARYSYESIKKKSPQSVQTSDDCEEFQGLGSAK